MARNSLPSPVHCTTPFFYLFLVQINIRNIHTTTQDSTGTTSLFRSFCSHASHVYRTYKKRQALPGRRRVPSCSARAPARQIISPLSGEMNLRPSLLRNHCELNADLFIHLRRLKRLAYHYTSEGKLEVPCFRSQYYTFPILSVRST